MTFFIVYNKAGDILRTGTCVEGDLDLQADEGEFVMEGEANDDLHIIVDGQVVDKPPPPAPTEAEQRADCQAQLRYQRDRLLLDSDFTQLSDVTISEGARAEWQAYRQALRDLPATYADATSIDEVVFPTEPGN